MGCVGTNSNSSWFYLYPPENLVIYMYTFAISCLGFVFNPVALQRQFIGKSDRATAKVVTLIISYPMVIVLPLLYLGIVVAVVFPDCQQSDGCGAIAMVAKSYVASGGMFLFCAVLLMTSCVAAFLSTADSLIIAITTSVMVDIVKQIHPTASPQAMRWGSRLCSVVVMVTTVSYALYNETNFIEIINYCVAFQALLILAFLPAWFPHQIKMVPVILSFIITGIMIPINEISFQEAACLSGDPSCVPSTETSDWITGAFRSLCWMFGTLLGTSGFFYLYTPLNFLLDDEELHRTWLKRDQVPQEELQRFGERRMRDDPVGLTKEIMKGTLEPIKHPVGGLVIVGSWLMVFFIHPWPKHIMPGFGYREEWSAEKVSAGWPEWALKFVIWDGVAIILCSYVCWNYWRDKTPSDNWEEAGVIAWLRGRGNPADVGVANKVFPHAAGATNVDETDSKGVEMRKGEMVTGQTREV